MLAAIKLEVMTPSADAPDEGSLGLSNGYSLQGFIASQFYLCFLNNIKYRVMLYVQLLSSTCHQFVRRLLGLGDQRR